MLGTSFVCLQDGELGPVGWGVPKEMTYANESRACTAGTRLTALSCGARISQDLFMKRPGVFSCLLAILQLAQA